MTDTMSKALEAAHRKAVEAARASARATGGQPYDGHPPPAYDVYREAFLAHLAEDEGMADKLADVIADAMNMNRTGRLEHDAALAALRTLSGKE